MMTEFESLAADNGRQAMGVPPSDNGGGGPSHFALAIGDGQAGTGPPNPSPADVGRVQMHSQAAEQPWPGLGNDMPPSVARANAVWDERHLRAATRAAGVALWAWNVDTDAINMDEHAFALWGIPATEHTITFETQSRNIHPADLMRVRSAFVATRAIVGAYEIGFRILHEGEVRWISARGQGVDADIAERIMFGIFLDVTQRKQAEEANELLAGEMSHRVTNLLQIATALTHISSRSASTKEEMALALASRLMALGRAQGLVRPTPGNKVEAALLGDLLAVLLAPYDEQGATVRIRISVPQLRVGETSSTTLALVIHELATNAAKYGALSADAGTLDVSCNVQGDDVIAVWTERGGPARVAPAKLGFGSMSIGAQKCPPIGIQS